MTHARIYEVGTTLTPLHLKSRTDVFSGYLQKTQLLLGSFFSEFKMTQQASETLIFV